MAIKVGVNGVVRTSSNIRAGVGGVVKTMSKGYVGKDSIVRQFFGSEEGLQIDRFIAADKWYGYRQYQGSAWGNDTWTATISGIPSACGMITGGTANSVTIRANKTYQIFIEFDLYAVFKDGSQMSLRSLTSAIPEYALSITVTQRLGYSGSGTGGGFVRGLGTYWQPTAWGTTQSKTFTAWSDKNYSDFRISANAQAGFSYVTNTVTLAIKFGARSYTVKLAL